MITRIYKDSYNVVRASNPNISSVKNWFPIAKVEREFIGFVFVWTTAIQVEHPYCSPHIMND